MIPAAFAGMEFISERARPEIAARRSFRRSEPENERAGSRFGPDGTGTFMIVNRRPLLLNPSHSAVLGRSRNED
jgi:hypothetical protein